MPTTSEKIAPCIHCGKREVIGMDAAGRMLCMCGENYYPQEQEGRRLQRVQCDRCKGSGTVEDHTPSK